MLDMILQVVDFCKVVILGQQLQPAYAGRSILWSVTAGNRSHTQVLAYPDDAPVHCGQRMSMRRGRYVCGVCGAEY